MLNCWWRDFYQYRLGPAMDLYMNAPIFSKGTSPIVDLDGLEVEPGCDRCWWWRGHVVGAAVGLLVGAVIF